MEPAIPAGMSDCDLRPGSATKASSSPVRWGAASGAGYLAKVFILRKTGNWQWDIRAGCPLGHPAGTPALLQTRRMRGQILFARRKTSAGKWTFIRSQLQHPTASHSFGFGVVWAGGPSAPSLRAHLFDFNFYQSGGVKLLLAWSLIVPACGASLEISANHGLEYYTLFLFRLQQVSTAKTHYAVVVHGVIHCRARIDEALHVGHTDTGGVTRGEVLQGAAGGCSVQVEPQRICGIIVIGKRDHIRLPILHKADVRHRACSKDFACLARHRAVGLPANARALAGCRYGMCIRSH